MALLCCVFFSTKWFFPLSVSTCIRFDEKYLRILLIILVALAIFFIYMTLAEGGGKKAIARKFSVAYAPVL